MTTTPLCRIADLSVRYDQLGATALSGVCLDIMAGERLAIVGESGSGKSTFARALANLLPPAATVGGRRDWREHNPPRLGKDLGFVFQDASASLNPVLRIGEQVAESARRHLGMTWPAAYDHAQAMLHRVRIHDAPAAMRAFPHQLSGGQRQRVAIAAAIAAQPSILIADEPTSALDTVVQAEIVKLLDDLVCDTGMTLIFVTHDIALASNLADRIAVFWNGGLLETGSVTSILTAPKCDYTAGLVAAHRDLTTPPLIGEVAG